VAQWQLQDAKARFSEFLNAALEKGPQIVTRRGLEMAVLVPIDEWRQLQQLARPALKELLLETTPTFDGLAPERGQLKRREPVKFE
jgi:prevent-host-death family protein